MKFIKGKKYLWTLHELELEFIGHEKDLAWFNCEHCQKEVKTFYEFVDFAGSSYKFGSECIKKVIAEI